MVSQRVNAGIFHAHASTAVEPAEQAWAHWAAKIRAVRSPSTRAGLPAAITSAGIELVTTLPAPMTELAPIRHPLEDLDAVADEHVLAELHGAHPRLCRRGGDPGADRGNRCRRSRRRTRSGRRADANPGALALDEGVVVDLHAIADLDHGVRAGGLDVAVARVERASMWASRTRRSRPRTIAPSPRNSTGCSTIGMPLTRRQVESARYFQTRAMRITSLRPGLHPS